MSENIERILQNRDEEVEKPVLKSEKHIILRLEDLREEFRKLNIHRSYREPLKNIQQHKPSHYSYHAFPSNIPLPSRYQEKMPTINAKDINLTK